MSVDLTVLIPKSKRQTIDIEAITNKISNTYPNIIFKSDDILFSGIRMVSYFPENDRIQLSSNASSADFVEFIASLFAIELGIDTIYDPSVGKEIPIQDIDRLYQKIQHQLTSAKSASKLRRLVPQNGKSFRFMQIENAIESLNNNHHQNVIVPSNNNVYAIVKSDTEGFSSILEIDKKLTFIDIEIEGDVSRIDKLIEEFASLLPANIKKI